MSYFRLFNFSEFKELVGSGGFEPPKSKDSGFTVRPIWPLWKLPVCRAEEGSRTPDLLITNQLLYQLSYFGFFLCNLPFSGALF
jgi:hypothetical protein